MTSPNILVKDDLSFLDNENVIFKRDRPMWLMNERRLRGGIQAMRELRPFKWETGTKGLAAYEKRVTNAVYMNFPAMFVETLVGHLFRERPEAGGALNWGALGQVRKRSDIAGDMSRAEQMQYNADGVGRDGSQWDAFWARQCKRAVATGHRWIFTDMPPKPRDEPTLGDESRGFRPYLVGLSPASVPDFHFDLGKSRYFIVRTPIRKPSRDSSGGMIGNEPKRTYLLMVAQGWTEFGTEYAEGGWWLYSPDKALMGQGTWDGLNGEIPMSALYYERDEGMEDYPAISRPGLTELGALAVQDMDLVSAANYNVWNSCSGIEHILGVTKEAYTLAWEKSQEGSQWIPWATDNMNGVTPGVVSSSAGAVSAEIIRQRLDLTREDAREVSARERTGAPDSTGISKMAGYADVQAPRLRLFAEEVETTQNTTLSHIAGRWGVKADATVKWPRTFELIEPQTRHENYLNARRLSGLSSPTADSRVMLEAAREARVVKDETDADVIRKEFEQSAKDAAAAATAFRDISGATGDPVPPIPPTGDA